MTTTTTAAVQEQDFGIASAEDEAEVKPQIYNMDLNYAN